MEIEEAQKRKKELQDNIKQILDKFMNETGLIVESISFDRVLNYDSRPVRIANVSIEVYI